jgi:hypothetical protein
MQLGVFWHARLYEKHAFFRIETGTEVVNRQLTHPILDLRGIGVSGGQGMPISDKVEAVVGLLKLDPVLQGPEVIAEVELARRAHAAEDPFFRHRLPFFTRLTMVIHYKGLLRRGFHA